MSASLRPLDGRPDLGGFERGRQAATESWQMLTSLLEATRIMPGDLLAPEGSLPLTILSGFLGAGKTTLLNRLLEAPGERRIAVLVNDFGRINIDASLIRSRTEDMISLTNGCACCTVSSDLTRTLIEIAQRPERPDALVLEASGLADPRGIAQVALSNPALRLDGIITLIDADGYEQARQTQAAAWTVDNQIDAADLLVLTKTDLAGPQTSAEIREALALKHPGKPVAVAVHGDLPAAVLLGVASTRDPRLERPASQQHTAGFASWCLRSAEPLADEALRAFLAALPAGLLRAKGVLRLSSAPEHRHVYQRVGQRATLAIDGTWDTREAMSSLVLIGPKDCLDGQALQRAFEGLATPPLHPIAPRRPSR